MDLGLPRVAGGVGPAQAVTSLEAAERHAVVAYLDRGSRLPLVVDQLVQRMERWLRLHVAREQPGNSRLARRAAVIDHVPPGDAHHRLDAEPDPV